MTKTQAKAALRKLMERIDDINAELYDLKAELEETAENIEPYEGYNDLTPEHEERQEWFEGAASALEDLIDAIDNASCELELD